MEPFNLRLITTAQVKMRKVLVKFVHGISNVNAYCVVVLTEGEKISTPLKEADRLHCLPRQIQGFLGTFSRDINENLFITKKKRTFQCAINFPVNEHLLTSGNSCKITLYVSLNTFKHFFFSLSSP